MNFQTGAPRLALFAVAAFAALKLTTFGWRFWAPSFRDGPGLEELSSRLEKHVTVLAAAIGPRDLYNNNSARLKKAEAYIAGEFRALGYAVEIQEYAVAGTTARNITAVKPGTTRKDETLVIGAHHDTFNNPGADDNASGVAGTLELARLLAGKPAARTLKFVSFANEEPPFFRTEEMGSAVWAEAAKKRGEKIAGFINLEMIGYFTEKPRSQKYPPLIGPFQPNRGNFIAQVSDFRSRALAGAIDAELRANSGLPLVTITLPAFVPGVDYSDHRNFWKRGYPAVMFTDTSFYRNPHYHKAADLPGTLNFRYMASLVKGLAAAAENLANRP